jgi:hypothetical protein
MCVKLADFPRLRFGQREDYTLMGALRAMLRFQGHDLSYPLLMAVSGAAFRHAWVPQAYATSAALAAPESLLITAARALGLQVRPFALAAPGGAWQSIRDSLLMGQPVLFWGGRRWRAAGILFGFDDDGSALWARTYTDKDDSGRRLPQAAWQQLVDEGIEAWSLAAPKKLRLPEAYDILKQAVTIAFADGDGTHQYGLAAYESWARTVLSTPPLPGSPETTLCVATTRTLLDARRAACDWLDALPRPLPSSLMNAMDCFTDAQYMLEELAMAFRQPIQDGGEWLARQIRAVGQEDARAISAIQATISIVAL